MGDELINPDDADTASPPRIGSIFELVGGGVGVMPDPDDNPDNHVVPHRDAGVRISFEVANVGEMDGTARVGIEGDDHFVTEWPSGQIEPGVRATGFVSVGRLSPGSHEALVYVNPGSGTNDHATNRFEIE